MLTGVDSEAVVRSAFLGDGEVATTVWGRRKALGYPSQTGGDAIQA
jgi:hypothetical protein